MSCIVPTMVESCGCVGWSSDQHAQIFADIRISAYILPSLPHLGNTELNVPHIASEARKGRRSSSGTLYRTLSIKPRHRTKKKNHVEMNLNLKMNVNLNQLKMNPKMYFTLGGSLLIFIQRDPILH